MGAFIRRFLLIVSCLVLLLPPRWCSFVSLSVHSKEEASQKAHGPPVRHPEGVRTALDRFVLAALEARSLSLAPEADRTTLVRRVSFDLTGLPPAPADVSAFLADTSPDAYERMVERYLASPHYGERWGKYWLDAAGYADSNGYFSADSDRPLAWKYRDYVIRSLNADKPYDRYVREQLAGDELAGYQPDGDVTPAMVEPLTATHFLRNAPDGTGESDGNPDEVRTDRLSVLEGTVQITMNCLLGLTIQCARCHGHKFEPITHRDYYALQAIFVPAYNPARWAPPKDRVVAVADRAARAEHRRRTEVIDREVKALRQGLADAAKQFRTQPDLQKLTDDQLTSRFPAYAAERERVRKAIAEREKDRPPPLQQLSVFVETDPSPPPHHVLKRGQHKTPGAEVEPGVPAALCTPGNVYRLAPRPAGRVSSGRRTALAQWVTSPQNPLFARVMVNRVWQHHFGVGLVSTPDNLGRSGAKPSHPELLDYLATEFVRGWSLKALHRLILTSAVYRQSTASPGPGPGIDPDNRLLWRYPLRRLDAEALRDAMLATSGELDLRAGGPYVPTRRTAEGSVEVAEDYAGSRRRSVYLQQRRTQVVTLLQLFDAPSLVGSCGTRTVSTVPLQALALLNSEFTRRRAQALAGRLEREAGADPERRLAMAFLLAIGRQPTPQETAAARRFLAAQSRVYAGQKGETGPAWADLCQMILASNAFLYVE
jgi:hypothetical protein